MMALRRFRLALAMTLSYRGRFPRYKMWRLYWQAAGRLVQR